MSEPTEVAKNIAKALELKEEGNQHFKEGNYQKAMAAYHQIFMYVHGYSASAGGGGSAGLAPPMGRTTTPVSPEEMAQIRELKVVHHCNLAICQMKHGPKYSKAKDNCTKALAIDGNNIKALLRRGKCHAQMGGLDEAKADLDRVLELQPDNKDAVRELRLLKGAFDKQRKKEQKKFAGMFDKLVDEDAAAAAAVSNASSAKAPSSSGSGGQHAQASISAAEGGGYKVNISCGENTPAVVDVADGSVDVGERVGGVESFEPQDVHYGGNST